MSTPEAQKLILAFQRNLEKRGKNGNTVRSYVNDIQQFFKWLVFTYGEDMTVAEITRGDITDFRGFLLTRKSSSTSVNRRITSLRQFFEMCAAEGIVPLNPVSTVTGIPSDPAMPQVLTRKDALLLVRTAEQAARAMETSVILLLLHAGLRSGEICGLTIGDLFLTPRVGRLFIRGQRKKTVRFVYLTTRTQAALRQYCKRMGISILAKRRRVEPLFSFSDGSALTQQAVDHIVKKVGKNAGIPNVTPTMLRNTYAVQLLLQGETPDAVARALGVTSIRNFVRLVELLKQDTRQG